MKTVILMRHSKATDESVGGGDFARPLTPQGRAMVLDSAALLTEAGIVIDRVLTSSALRTSQTAQLIAETVCPDAPLVALDDLYLSPASGYVPALWQNADPTDQTVLLVGHNPGIAQLMQWWSGRALDVSPCTVLVLDSEFADWQSIPARPERPFAVRCLIQKGKRKD